MSFSLFSRRYAKAAIEILKQHDLGAYVEVTLLPGRERAVIETVGAAGFGARVQMGGHLLTRMWHDKGKTWEVRS